jgi:hypothetical protein
VATDANDVTATDDRLRPSRRAVLAIGGALLLPGTAWGDAAPNLRLGPDAVPVQAAPDYLRHHPAPDYWALSPYYAGQITNSACALATAAMLVNALRGLPRSAEPALVTQHDLLAALADPKWTTRTAEGGAGVTFAEFAKLLDLSLAAFGVMAAFETFAPRDAGAETLARMRDMLADNERSDTDIVLSYFNQGVLTGDWDGPHTSPLAAYDAETRRVLVMDVDRRWYVPYWSPDAALLRAMLRPAPASEGLLAGETGGLIRVTRQSRG